MADQKECSHCDKKTPPKWSVVRHMRIPPRQMQRPEEQERVEEGFRLRQLRTPTASPPTTANPFITANLTATGHFANTWKLLGHDNRRTLSKTETNI